MQEVFIRREAVMGMIRSLKDLDTSGARMREQFRVLSESTLNLADLLTTLHSALETAPQAADISGFDDLSAAVQALSDSLEPMRRAVENASESNLAHSKSLARLRSTLESAV